MNNELKEIVYCLQQLQSEFEDLAVGGLRSFGPEHIPLLNGFREQLEAIGANHLGERLQILVDAITNNDTNAAAALMRAQASIRMFERILTIDTITEELPSMIAMESS